MEAYRLVKEKYASDPLDSQGAKLYGGRWNSKGVPVVYASDSIALVTLEKLVHLHRSNVLNHFALCTISFNNTQMMRLPDEELPSNWRDDPPPNSTTIIGDEWLSGVESLVLAVPSTVIPQQTNLLINPKHADYANLIKSVVVAPFVFDARLS